MKIKIYLYIYSILILNQLNIALTNDKNEFIIYLNDSSIFRVNNDSLNPNKSLLVEFSKNSELKYFDYSLQDNLIIWIDKSYNKIKATYFNTEISKTYNIIDTETYKDLAFDWLTKKIYWIDIDPFRIQAIDLDGKNNCLIVLLEKYIPYVIALAPLKGLLFFSNCNGNGSIERISMDGNIETRKSIIYNTCANDLAIDHNLDKIYWSDFDKINSATFNGGAFKVIIKSITPHGVTLYDKKIFWIETSVKSIFSCNIINRSQKKLLVENLSTKSVLHFHSSKNQPFKETPCSFNNGGCSHICLLSNTSEGFSCACPIGIKLLDDKKTCATQIEKFLFFNTDNLKYISLDKDYFYSFNTKIKSTIFEIDPIEEKIFWTNISSSSIEISFLNGSNHLTLLIDPNSKIENLVLDPLNRNLYTIKKGEFTSIEVVSLTKNISKVLIDTYIDEPKGLAIHPEEGYFYWSDCGSCPKIEKVSLDGKIRKKIVSSSINWPNNLVIDYEYNQLYWCDNNFATIEYSDLNGKNRKILVKIKNNILFGGLTILDEFLYYTNIINSKIYIIDKISGDSKFFIDNFNDVKHIKAVSRTFRMGTNNYCLNLNCSDFCFGTYKCGCATGYQLLNNSLSCELGENQCLKENGNCDHDCLHVIGNHYRCKCKENYNLSLDKRECVKNKIKIHRLIKKILCPNCCKPNNLSHNCIEINNKYHCICSKSVVISSDSRTCLNNYNDNLLDKYNNEDNLEINQEFSKINFNLNYKYLILFFIFIFFILIFIIKNCAFIMNKKELELDYNKEKNLEKKESLTDIDRNVTGTSDLDNFLFENFDNTFSFTKHSTKSHSYAPPPTPISYMDNFIIKEDFDNQSIDFSIQSYRPTLVPPSTPVI